MLAPGETNVYGDRFIASMIAPYLQAQMMCSSTRFSFKFPNILLGLIPVGTEENTIPIGNIASVSTSSTFLARRFLVGLFLALISLASLGTNLLIGLAFLVPAAAAFLTSFPSVLEVRDPAGGSTGVVVSPLEKAKLQKFSEELRQRVFADQAQLHHEDAQAVRTQQVMLQQLALQQQMSTQQQALAFQQQTPPQQQVPAAPPAPQVPPADPATAQYPPAPPATAPQPLSEAPADPAAPSAASGSQPS